MCVSIPAPFLRTNIIPFGIRFLYFLTPCVPRLGLRHTIVPMRRISTRWIGWKRGRLHAPNEMSGLKSAGQSRDNGFPCLLKLFVGSSFDSECFVKSQRYAVVTTSMVFSETSFFPSRKSRINSRKEEPFHFSSSS